MKTYQVTKHEGELLGPVDLRYDYRKHDWGKGNGGINPRCSQEGWELIQKVKIGDYVRLAHSDYLKRVISVGMYDGWPLWKPTPAVYVDGNLGGEWRFFYDIREHHPKQSNSESEWPH